MGYIIEISNDVRKPSKLIKNLQERREMAEDHMCEMQYFMHEIEGKKRTIIRSDSIQVVMFGSEQFENLLNFIVNIRKTKSFYIECVYRDDNSCAICYLYPQSTCNEWIETLQEH